MWNKAMDDDYDISISPETQALLDELKAKEPGLTNAEILRRGVRCMKLPGRTTPSVDTPTIDKNGNET